MEEKRNKRAALITAFMKGLFKGYFVRCEKSPGRGWMYVYISDSREVSITLDAMRAIVNFANKCIGYDLSLSYCPHPSRRDPMTGMKIMVPTFMFDLDIVWGEECDDTVEEEKFYQVAASGDAGCGL